MRRSQRPAPATAVLPGWERLNHGGLLFDGPRLAELAAFTPPPLNPYAAGQLRQRATALLAGGGGDGGDRARFAAFVLERVCGLDEATGTWTRGSRVAPAWGRRAVTGQLVKPHHLWRGRRGAVLPVFLDRERRLGVGRGRRSVSLALGWLRAGSEHLALITNGRQWRLLFAGLDYDAWCEWDLDLWFDEGELSPQVTALRTLFSARTWTPPAEGAAPPLLQAVRDARKGQAELSEALGERVREAVELLIHAHGDALRPLLAGARSATPEEIYRAACRVAMRLVVILFAEARDLLPRGNTVYRDSYGLEGLLHQLERGGGPPADAYSAWPRVQALFRLVRDGSHHPSLPVTAYGGALFAAGAHDAPDGVARALAVFERACFDDHVLPDRDVREMLRLLTRTTVRIRQGRAGTRTVTPVDFADLSSEYLGVLYEGLLDYELKTAEGDPVIFLAVGDQPALPLPRLEAMDDAALRALFESLKGSAGGGAEEAAPAPADAAEKDAGEEDGPAADADAVGDAADDAEAAAAPSDDRRRHRTRAETWARRAAQVAGLVRRRRGRGTPERRLAHERELALTARRLVARVVLPGEWYLVRWGGTRKGSGSFYTRPGLAVPTVQRALRPLAYDPPSNPAGGAPDRDAPPARWTPKPPEHILALTVCDPACGSGTFPLAALRFLTDALYASLLHHRRITPDPSDGARSLVRLLGIDGGAQPTGGPERLIDELIPCRPDDAEFEPRLKAVLRRHVVERCLYAVDLDPLAVELCRLALWIETMDRTLPFGFLDHKVKCGNALLGAWFDRFRHYPVMAWKNRDGGDRTHLGGVHFARDARTKAIKGFVKEKLTPDLRQFLRGPDLFQQEDLLKNAAAAHGEALEVLEAMHALPVQDAAARARRYRDDLLGSPAWQSLKAALDRWCACWFWPPGEIDCAPLPTTFTAPPPKTQAVAARVAAELRFFHWELEFPDVFRAPGDGFDAILGNPPWDIAKPVSQEFFSNVDPLYRSYGKQEALRRQAGYFVDRDLERGWLDYNARFRAQSNFVGHAAHPFGDPKETAKSQDRFAAARGNENGALHDRWREARRRGAGYGDPAHPFRHQGAADLNLYKLFLEAAHGLLRPGGRLGFIVPSGLYSDHGTRALRTLLLEKCRWEWLFGIENRDRIFPIHGRFKFNPVVVEKGGATEAIRTAFMRRNLDDWERAEELATRYSRAQIARFSPRSRAILEIQSQRDLDILEKIYANSVLLGDDGPGGWGIRYATEFHMTGDSRLFPPRPQWEAKGYRPDEYSRWLLGDWRPIGELWAELGVDPARPQPAAVELAGWLFDAAAGPARRAAEARFLHGHLLKPGDAARTGWRLRCAAPPCDRLPVPRAALPPGVILSREADAWLPEDAIRDVALPLYEGRMIGQFDYSQKGWVSGKGRAAVWRDVPWSRKQIEPQFLMAIDDYRSAIDMPDQPKVLHMRIGSATNIRTAIAAFAVGMPSGDTAAAFYTGSLRHTLVLAAILNTLVSDFVTRSRLIGLHLDYHVMDQSPLPVIERPDLYQVIADLSARLSANPPWYSCLTNGAAPASSIGAERARHLAILNALIADQYRITSADLRRIIADCDLPTEHLKRRTHGTGLDPKGFWRVDQDAPPELRHTVLTLVALHDLEARIESAGGDRERGIGAFLTQNDGEGWLLPETLRLADYGLGHDDRARHPQPVAGRLGPRFYDWQLAQPAEEAQRESQLHARNLLGAFRYESLRRGDHYAVPDEQPHRRVAESRVPYATDSGPQDRQPDLFAPQDTGSGA